RFRVAHASRVLVSASRRNSLSEKSAMTRRHRQHARRVCYPERASTANLLLITRDPERNASPARTRGSQCVTGQLSPRDGEPGLADFVGCVAASTRLALGMTSVAEFHTIFFVNTSSVPRRRKI